MSGLAAAAAETADDESADEDVVGDKAQWSGTDAEPHIDDLGDDLAVGIAKCPDSMGNIGFPCRAGKATVVGDLDLRCARRGVEIEHDVLAVGEVGAGVDRDVVVR